MQACTEKTVQAFSFQLPGGCHMSKAIVLTQEYHYQYMDSDKSIKEATLLPGAYGIQETIPGFLVPWATKEHLFKLIIGDKVIPVQFDDGEFELIENWYTGYETDSQIARRVERRFSVMEMLTDGVMNGSIRSLIISGAPGIGKTHSLEHKLEKRFLDGTISKYTPKKGEMRATILYEELYHHSEKGQVLILDDVDVYKDDQALRILKAAMDTSSGGKVAWNSLGRWIEDKGLPNEFEFRGSLVFITNDDMDAMIEAGNARAVHYKAMMDRAIYLNLGVHSRREIMIRIEQIIRSTTILDKLTPEDKEKVIQWVRRYHEKTRTLSIRTIVKITEELMTANYENWEMLATETLLKGNGSGI